MLVALLCVLAALQASAFQAPRAATLPRVARAAAADKDAGAYRELYEKAEYERQRAAKAGKRYQIIATAKKNRTVSYDNDVTFLAKIRQRFA